MTEVELITITAAVLRGNSGEYDTRSRAIEEAYFLLDLAREEYFKRKEGAPKKKDALDFELCDLNFNVRAFNALKGAGLMTVRDIVKTTPAQLSVIKHMGAKTVKHIQEVLSEIGISF